MPAIIASLHNKNNDLMYPETVVTAVHMPDGKRTLMAEIEELKDESCTTSFNNDGTITKVMTYSGMIYTTTFNNDGSITETCEYSDHTLYYTKTTVFNNDGSITVDKQYADNSEEEEEEEEETEESGGGE